MSNLQFGQDLPISDSNSEFIVVPASKDYNTSLAITCVAQEESEEKENATSSSNLQNEDLTSHQGTRCGVCLLILVILVFFFV